MARAPSPTMSPARPEDPSAGADVNTSMDEAAELRDLSAAVRSKLRWLEAGGVAGLPRPQRQAPRPAAAPPASAAVPSRGAHPLESSIEHAVPAALPRESTPRLAAPRAVATRQAAVTEAVYPELPELATLQGAEGLSTVRRVLGDCRRCKLCHGRNNIVFDDGNAGAWLAFVGEGPGADEDRLGKPFVGAAGQLLDRMIDAMAGEARKRGHEELAMHLSRSAVYICNVVKCRPPGNRTPEADEVAACTPFLRGQLSSLRPNLRAIVTLGRTPTQYLLKTSTPISSLRGRFASWEGIPVMPTYHPAYLLRTPSAKRQVWEDLQQVLEALSAPPQPK